MPCHVFAGQKVGVTQVGVTCDGADVALDAVSDTCLPRCILLDHSRWRPAGTPERPPVRNSVATRQRVARRKQSALQAS
jgi:hypothetical protein